MKNLILILALIFCKSIAASTPQIEYRVLERQTQTRDNFVQGLEIFDNKIYLSSGGYGKSILRKYDLKNGGLELERAMSSNIFAEGLTIFKNRLYLLLTFSCHSASQPCRNLSRK